MNRLSFKKRDIITGTDIQEAWACEDGFVIMFKDIRKGYFSAYDKISVSVDLRLFANSRHKELYK